MSRLRPFPIVGGAYTDDALPWAHQDTVNYLPVRAEREGTRSPAKLAMVPGMRVVADVGTGPHRGGRDVEGQSFVVSGTTLYKVAGNGVTTSCGTIPGTGRVRMTHNQITGGNQVFIATGSSGYVYDTVAETLSQVTDDAFPGAKSCDFLGQYILGVEPFGRYWFHSALVDATDYNSLDVFQAETSPDRIVGLIASHNEVLIFGERTIEPWANVPTENAAFQLQVGSVIETGCASGDTLCRLDNSVYFLTDKGQVAKLEGYTPRVISTYAMEGAISRCDLSRAFAFTWEDKGHTVYYITFPDGQTWGYDVRQNEWHRRESYGIDRWRLNTLFKSNGLWYGGDYQTGKLYRLDWDFALEGCDPIDRRRVTGYIHDNGEPVRVNAFQVQMDSGSEESVPHDGVTVSGTLPDGFVGDAVSYQYTITLAYPGQSYSLVAEGLPDGVTLSATGLATGTFENDDTFAITITGTDDCGNATTHSDSVVVAGFTIAGDVPDGTVGESPSGAYTNTHGVEPITYAVTAGTFPAGLTLAEDGTYSGEFTTGGVYSWTVTGTDAKGNTATVGDTSTVGVSEWWMVVDSETDTLKNKLWIGTDGLTYGTQTTRTPNTSSARGAVYAGSGKMVIYPDATVTTDVQIIEVIADPQATAMTTTTVDIGDSINVSNGLRLYDDTLIGLVNGENQYFYSTDGGATVGIVTGPGTASDLLGMARLSSGRWVALTGVSVGGAFYYSDVALPTASDWTSAGAADGGSGSNARYPGIVTDGTSAIVFDGTSDIFITTTGEGWSKGASGLTITAADPQCGIGFDGTFLFGESDGSLIRSTDSGASLARVYLNGSGTVSSRGVFWLDRDHFTGVIVASCVDHTVWASDDDGATWTQATLPFTPSFDDEVRVGFNPLGIVR